MKMENETDDQEIAAAYLHDASRQLQQAIISQKRDRIISMIQFTQRSIHQYLRSVETNKHLLNIKREN